MSKFKSGDYVLIRRIENPQPAWNHAGEMEYLHKNISVVLDEYDTDSFKVRTNSGRDRWIVDDRCATLIPPPDGT